jgi:2-polyprenyl-3-methyl-5-hydroxy-6-metoxy-1,4-benzoquinol methylase
MLTLTIHIISANHYSMNNQIEYEILSACPVCGSKEKKFLFTNTDRMHGIPGEFGLNQCKDCKAFYLSPRPTLKALPQYYPDDYPPHQGNILEPSGFLRNIRELLRNTILYEQYHYENFEHKPRIKPNVAGKLLAYLSFFFWDRARYGISATVFPPYVKDGKVLDIGCGPGYFLLILKKLGFETYGIEPSEKAASFGREKLRLDIKTGTLLDHKFPDNYFHFITMNHVLEHLHNPVEVLSEAKRILHPDGMIMIRTPNMDSYGYQRFGKNWGPLETPRHLILYSKQSIAGLADKTGLILKRFSTTHARSLLYWSLEYEMRSKNNNNKDFGLTGQYTIFQKLYINALDLYERLLILSGNDAGEELQAVLVKR